MYTLDLSQWSKLARRLADYRLILIAPRLRNRAAVLASIMDEATPSLYFTLTAEHRELPDFVGGIIETIKTYESKFSGKQSLTAARNGNPHDMADALAADIGKARSKPQRLILDCFDELGFTPEAHVFFRRLIEVLPQGMQLVINGRYLDYRLWMPLVEAGIGYVLGNEATGGVFDAETLSKPHLEVYALSNGNVYVNGNPLTNWDGPLPRNLFYFFVDHEMVTRAEIFETFWPDLPSKEATNVFHVTKRKISERLGYELTAYGTGFYHSSGQMVVHYDVRNFENAVQACIASKSEDPAAWYRAIQLYRAPYLTRVELPWIARRREALRNVYAEALIGAARAHTNARNTEDAIHFYLRALKEVPEREDIHRDLMKLYGHQGRRDHVESQYRLLCRILDRTLSITPSRATQSVYKEIMEGAK